MVHEVDLPEWARGRPAVVVERLRLRQQRGSSMGTSIIPLGSTSPSEYLVLKSDPTLTVLLKEAQQAKAVPPGMSLDQFKQHLEQQQKLGDLFYRVNIKSGTCTCPDCRLNRFVCKHMFAIFHYSAAMKWAQQWSFSDLPPSLTQAPHMVIDGSMVQAAAEPVTEADAWLERVVTGEGDDVGGSGDEEDSDPLPQSCTHSNTTKRQWEDTLHLLKSLWHASPGVREQLLAGMLQLHDRLSKVEQPDGWDGPSAAAPSAATAGAAPRAATPAAATASAATPAAAAAPAATAAVAAAKASTSSHAAAPAATPAAAAAPAVATTTAASWLSNHATPT